MTKASSDCSSTMDSVSRKFSLSSCCLLGGTCYFLICMQICLFISLWFSLLQSRVAYLWFLQASKSHAVPPHHSHTIHGKSGQENSIKFRPWEFSLALAAVKVGLSPLEPFSDTRELIFFVLFFVRVQTALQQWKWQNVQPDIADLTVEVARQIHMG